MSDQQLWVVEKGGGFVTLLEGVVVDMVIIGVGHATVCFGVAGDFDSVIGDGVSLC